MCAFEGTSHITLSQFGYVRSIYTLGISNAANQGIVCVHAHSEIVLHLLGCRLLQSHTSSSVPGAGGFRIL